MAWAPNAGHTYVDGNGRKFVNIALPNGIISKNLKQILIGPGSVINPDILMSEIMAYADLLNDVEILIHENAAIVTEDHRTDEAQGMVGIGSTMKGVGAATIQKIKRQTNPADQNTAREMLRGTPLEGLVVDRWEYAAAVDKAEVMLVEGAQGFSLGINSGFYPYTTSRECTVAQIISDCGLPLSILDKENCTVWGAARTFPIRVANRFKDGVQIGWSGPCYPDQDEIDWSDLGIEPELTTVTRLPRRIFTFSYDQIKDAVRMNGVDKIFLNFGNYMEPGDFAKMIIRVNEESGAEVELIGLGPTYNDVFTMREHISHKTIGAHNAQ
jgi:adenylosuccinate synthase